MFAEAMLISKPIINTKSGLERIIHTCHKLKNSNSQLQYALNLKQSIIYK